MEAVTQLVGQRLHLSWATRAGLEVMARFNHQQANLWQWGKPKAKPERVRVRSGEGEQGHTESRLPGRSIMTTINIEVGSQSRG